MGEGAFPPPLDRSHPLWHLTQQAVLERRTAGHAPGCFGYVTTDDGPECDCRPAGNGDPDPRAFTP